MAHSMQQTAPDPQPRMPLVPIPLRPTPLMLIPALSHAVQQPCAVWLVSIAQDNKHPGGGSVPLGGSGHAEQALAAPACPHAHRRAQLLAEPSQAPPACPLLLSLHPDTAGSWSTRSLPADLHRGLVATSAIDGQREEQRSTVRSGEEAAEAMRRHQLDQALRVSSPRLGQQAEQSKRRKPWKIALTEVEAKHIFLQRPDKAHAKRGTSTRLSIELAKQYGVSQKTIRDIWNGDTWAKVTSGE
ncbi:hypothetical protein GUITHDRAFT_109487 [Guillardia theta CCMP2712]|uniref:Uncharacterized protein n=1 Tax=Guillardia theta (strain CCMP2712) TaxID=905079 RepID=L1J9D0_GUITC|nr:hypothetical protein GUITHDRAFT_109486 [Guillardia theta CCMP2712]XP_005831689.1 hypothetical protein GUITHDRAFT_109487 [Guillardia theta CCMP2712]EKX44708.1 hypothetical protein GUITHDRAFT_109486 [Guillardia theta CCMP2712]EKX44709.1 hypothetical protein GUITHDRAFT_109487 [Guillardia theta CCMP2712]|eukprot:XP_005831688.1 hypothetical protein GUITHDRAFT_109486 [Guillardia theta CCMP2712]